MYELNSQKNINFSYIDTENLADIKNISVDKSLSKDDRLAEYVRQIKNPYCFKCGNFIVRVKFSDNGISLEDCLMSILI